MKLMRIGPVGQERPCLVVEGVSYDLSSLTRDIDADFWEQDTLGEALSLIEVGSLPRFGDPCDGSGLRIGPPIARPAAIICIGMNYAAHAAESGATPPNDPVVFFKHPNTLIGPNDDVVIPRGANKVDWEVELAVVVKRRVRYLASPEEAAGYIAGYALSNDVSERGFQLELSGGQWSKGKSCETFNPLGPWLIPASAIPDPQSLRLRSWVNGEPRQDSSTVDMIFSVSNLIWHLSQFMVLEPGDLINTGTPQGVALSERFPYLRAGDVIETEIDQLGHQRQVCITSQ